MIIETESSGTSAINIVTSSLDHLPIHLFKNKSMRASGEALLPTALVYFHTFLFSSGASVEGQGDSFKGPYCKGSFFSFYFLGLFW